MTFFTGVLTFVLVVLCLALILLVLIQLPKKEAGIGVAFGGAATDALFGAGSGNVLTKATKYAATGFFILAILVGFMQSRTSPNNKTTDFQSAIEQQARQGATGGATAGTPASGSPSAPVAPLMSQPAATSAPAAAPAPAAQK